jgi:hypothetical protein
MAIIAATWPGHNHGAPNAAQLTTRLRRANVPYGSTPASRYENQASGFNHQIHRATVTRIARRALGSEPASNLSVLFREYSAMTQRFRKCRVTGLDWGAVVAVARETAAAAGMAERYDTIAGSAFEVSWGEGYDLVLVPNFLHHFDAASCTDILRRARACLSARRPCGNRRMGAQ